MKASARKSNMPRSDSSTPPFTILLATAGEPESRGAVRTAARLARHLHASVDVLTVAAPFPHLAPPITLEPSPALIDEDSRANALDATRTQLRQVRGTAGWRVHATIGWAKDLIVTTARRANASLIIVGTGEHPAMARLFGSETAIGVAKHAGTPILAVPADFDRPPRHAVAAIDFSPSSAAAARFVAKLLPSRGTLTLVHTSVFAAAALEPGSFTDVYAAGETQRLSLIAEQIARSTGRRVKTLIAQGTVGDALLSAVESLHADIIALGSHNYRFVERLAFGSVGAKLLRHPPCAVLIMPHDSPAET